MRRAVTYDNQIKTRTIEAPSITSPYHPRFWHLQLANTLSSVIRTAVAEPIQVFERERISDYCGPFVFALEHDSRWDGGTLPSLWRTMPQYPFLLKGVRRSRAFGGLSYIFNPLTSPIAITIYSEKEIEALPEHKQAKARKKNKRAMEKAKAQLERGTSIGIMPAGTSVSKGNPQDDKIYRGVYKLSHFWREDGSLDTVPVVPIGVSTDFLSGPEGIFGRKQIICLQFGKPFFYRPLQLGAWETEEGRKIRDREHFLEQVKENIIAQNVFTLAQLAGDWIVGLARGLDTYNHPFQRRALETIVLNRVNRLDKAGFAVEEGLLDERFSERMDNFLREIIIQGYVIETRDGFTIKKERTLHEPEDVSRFKKRHGGLSPKKEAGNLLLYAANNIEGMRGTSTTLRDILEDRIVRI